jgi:Xaa-Pro aminopeptidase
MSLDQRRESCVRLLESRALDCLVGFGGSIHNFLLCEPALVLAGFRTIGPTAIVLERSGRLTMLVSPAWDAPRADRIAAGRAAVRPADDLVEALAGFLADAKVRGDRIGFAGSDLLPSALSRALIERLGAGAVDLDREVREIDRIRSPEELENARKATEIAEKGHQRLLEIARPGMAEYQFAADIFCYMKGLGAEDNFLLINSSQHGSGVAPPGRRVIQEGDLILAEITPSHGWQFSQICRTVSVGRPAQTALDKFALLDRALQAGLKSAVPGTTVAATADAINRVLIDAGYGKYCGPPYMRVRGHGLGNLSDLPGDIDSGNQAVIEENMLFVMHPNQYLPETGYMMCGEPVRIAKDGAVPLTSRRGTLDWVPA